MSERHPAATREHHDQFCEIEGWVLVRGASGRPVSHHRTYELSLWDGRILRTRISQPVDKSTYSLSMWAHILRAQLEVTADSFWACVQDGAIPDRGRPVVPDQKKTVPLYLFRALRDLGIDEKAILALDAAGAAALHAELLRSASE